MARHPFLAFSDVCTNFTPRQILFVVIEPAVEAAGESAETCIWKGRESWSSQDKRKQAKLHAAPTHSLTSISQRLSAREYKSLQRP